MPEPRHTYRTGKPGLMEWLLGWAQGEPVPEAYAYSRFSREPVEFTDGPANFLGDRGQHSDYQGGIRVDATAPDPEGTLLHEQGHHAFDPWKVGQQDQESYIETLLGDDPTARSTMLKVMRQKQVPADYTLLETLMRQRPK